MATMKLNVEVDKLQNVVEWFRHNFVCGKEPSNVGALFMFANLLGTPMDQDGSMKYSAFKDEDEAAEYLEALGQVKFIIQSKLVDQDIVRDDMTLEILHVTETWQIICTPSIGNTRDAFVAYCPRPYHVIRPFEV